MSFYGTPSIKNKNFSLNIIIRKWENYLPEWEFRAFIINDEMVACSQYYSLCYIPEIANQKQKIAEHLRLYFDSIKHLIPIKNYTIDFALFPDFSKIWVIEINHPPPIAGLCLFNWDNPEDRKIVTEGPFQLRVNEIPILSPLSQIHPPLMHFLWEIRNSSKTKTISSLQNISDFIHRGYSCDICKILPITGLRYHCSACPGSFDLCANCYKNKELEQHSSHPFIKFSSNHLSEPASPREPDTKGSNCSLQ